MSTLATLIVKLTGDVTGLRSSLDDASSMVRRAGDGMSAAGGTLTTKVTLPIIGAGAAAVVMGNQFNSGMANVISLAPEAAGEIAGMSSGVQQLAQDMGASTTDMTDGLYQVVSAFGLSNESLDLLETNAMAAAAGLATTEEALALTSAVTKGYGDTTAEAVQHAADLALKTVQLGQTTFPELAASIGSVTPLAASLGVTQAELFGVMATATGVTGNASAVSTQFRGVLQSLMSPTTEMSALLEQMGFASGQAMIEQLGLQGTIDTITAAATASGQPLQAYIGSIEGQTLAMALSGPQADTFSQKLAEMQNAAGTTQAAFDAQTQGINANGFAMQQTAIQVQVMAQQIGQALQPAITTIMPYVTQFLGWIQGLVQRFTELDPKTQGIILAVVGLAAALGPLLLVLGPIVSGIGAVGAVIGALASPIGIIIAAVALLAAAWATDFGGIRTTVTEFWNTHLKPIFDTLVTWLKTNIPVALEKLAEFWENTLQPAIATVWEFLEQNIFPVFETLVDVWFAALKIELELLAGVWENVLKPALETVWEFLQEHIIPIIVGLVDVNIAALKLALTLLALIWETVLQPALETVWLFLQDQVIPKFVDLKAKLDGPVTTALNAISKIFDKVSGAIGAVSSAVETAIGWLQDLINWANTALDLLRQVGGGGGKGATREAIGGSGAAGEMATQTQTIGNALSALVNAFSSVAAYKPDQIGPKLNILFDQLRGVIFKLEKLSTWMKAPGLQAAVAVAEAGGKITSNLKSLVDGFTAVAAYKAEQIGAVLNILFDQLRGVIFKLQKTAGLVDMDGLPAAVTLAETGGKITGQLKGMVDGFTAVAAYKAEQIGPALNVLFDQLRETVRLMVAAALEFDAAQVEAGALFAQTAGQITGPLSAIIDALDAVAAYGQAGKVNFAAKIGQLMADLRATATGIVFGLREFGRDVLASLEESAATTTALGGLVDFVDGTAGALNTVAGYGQEGKVNFAARIGQLMADLRATATGIVFGLRGFGRDVLASLEDTAATTDALGRLVAFVDGTAGSLNAVAVYGQSGQVDFAARIGLLMADLRATATGIVTALREFGRDVLASLEDAAETTDALGRLVAFVDGAVGALNTVAGYTSAADLAARVRAFAADVVTLANLLMLGLGGLSEPLAEAYDAAIAFGQRIAAIVGVVRPGMEAIAAVVSYTRGTVDLRAQVALFVADVLLVAEGLRDGLSAPSQAILDAYDAARTFAERIVALLNFVRPALETLREIERYGGAGNLHTGTLNFLRHIEGLINALATTFEALGPDVVRGAGEFSDLIRSIVSNMTGAMRDLAGLGDVQALVDAAFGVGSSWVDGLIDGLSSRLGDLADLMAYIRGLFPSSPAQYGAWRTLPDGASVGSAFTGDLTGELTRGERGVNAAMARLHGALGGGGGGGRGGAAGGGAGGTAVTINFQQPVVVREDADIQRLAQAVGDVLARQASTNKRMTAAWATADRA